MKKKTFLTIIALLGICIVGCARLAKSDETGERLENFRSLIRARRDASKEANSSSANVVLQNWNDARRTRDIPVKIYLPKSGSPPYPVVIFSHGLGGSRDAAEYLGEAWSEHGYVGVFIQHPGSDSAVWQSSLGSGREAMMRSMKAAANAKNLVARVDDVKFTLDQLDKRSKTDPVLKGQLDLNKIALAGHSFGAGTTLAVAGQNFGDGKINGTDSRIKAAIYLCPPVGGGKIAPDRSYGSIKIPGLLLTGTEDNSPIGNTTAAERRIPFDGMKAPHQYLINFVGADHAVFGGRSFRSAKQGDDDFHKMIIEVTTKFLDSNLKGDASASRWLDSSAAKAYLGKMATLERK
jgi:predicted dienelactone hydrolase